MPAEERGSEVLGVSAGNLSGPGMDQDSDMDVTEEPAWQLNVNNRERSELLNASEASRKCESFSIGRHPWQPVRAGKLCGKQSTKFLR